MKKSKFTVNHMYNGMSPKQARRWERREKRNSFLSGEEYMKEFILGKKFL